MAQIKPCAGGLGEALIPQRGGFGGKTPKLGFSQEQLFAA
jgi:hypothetical protein